jgi:hypothetical protein
MWHHGRQYSLDRVQSADAGVVIVLSNVGWRSQRRSQTLPCRPTHLRRSWEPCYLKQWEATGRITGWRHCRWWCFCFRGTMDCDQTRVSVFAARSIYEKAQDSRADATSKRDTVF